MTIRLPIILGLLALCAPATAAPLAITVTGIQRAKGSILAEILTEAGKPAGVTGAAIQASGVLMLKPVDLAPGRYAVRLYQDVNDNRQLDSGLFGIPSEPYGFSNNPKARFGPPKLATMLMMVPETGHAVTIALQGQ